MKKERGGIILPGSNCRWVTWKLDLLHCNSVLFQFFCAASFKGTNHIFLFYTLHSSTGSSMMMITDDILIALKKNGSKHIIWCCCCWTMILVVSASHVHTCGWMCVFHTPAKPLIEPNVSLNPCFHGKPWKVCRMVTIVGGHGGRSVLVSWGEFPNHSFSHEIIIWPPKSSSVKNHWEEL